MTPRQDLSFALHTTSGLSPLWLLLLLPAALGLGILLYHQEIKRLPHRQRLVLYLLRLTMLTLVAVSLFMPNLEIIRRLDFPGRILLLIDNSESMTAADSSMPVLDTLPLARTLDPDAVEPGSPETAFHELALGLKEILVHGRLCARGLSNTPASPRAGQQATRTFRDRAIAVLLRCADVRKQLPLDELSDESQVACAVFVKALDKAGSDIRAVAGQDGGVLPAVRQVCTELERLLGECQRFQRELDAKTPREGDSPASDPDAGITTTPRLELVNSRITSLLPRLKDWVPDQYVQVVEVISGGAEVVGRRGKAPMPESARGRTDLAGRLRAIIEQDDPFPLTGVVVISDGVDLSVTELDSVLGEYVDRRVPISVVGVGHTEEPYDLAIADVRAPPVAVKGQRILIEIRLKAAVSSAATGSLVIRRGEQTVATQEVELKRERQMAYVPLTPAVVGLQRYSVELQTDAEDAFENRNNSGAFVLDVREENLRVLLLDDRPRWQTRFVVNILSRLPYVDLNTIIRSVQEDGDVKRGATKGSWPTSRELLDVYDVIVLGDLGAGILTDTEWQDLAAAVTDGGATLAVLGAAPLRDVSHVIPELRPLSASTLLGQTVEAVADLRLTPEGALHPLTRAFAAHLPTTPVPAAENDVARSVLLHDVRIRLPVLTCASTGAGRVLVLHAAELWSILNERRLAEHAAIFMNLVSWAANARGGPVALDQQVLKEGAGFQAWSRGKPTDLSVVDAQGNKVAEPVETAASNGAFARAVFAPLPPGEYRLKAKGAENGEPLHVIADNEELVILAQQTAYLRGLSRVTGGSYRSLANMDTLFPAMDLQTRTEVHRYVLPLWRSQFSLLFLLLLFAAEWVLRKYWGLV